MHLRGAPAGVAGLDDRVGQGGQADHREDLAEGIEPSPELAQELSEEAFAPLSVTIGLEDDVDVGRGDLIAAADGAPEPVRELAATVCWLGDAPARPGARYLLKHTTRTVRAKVDAVADRLDVSTLAHEPAAELALNDIGTLRLRLGEPVMTDPYADVRATGAFILIDEATNETVGAGMVSPSPRG